jgi:hypothetical protein
MKKIVTLFQRNYETDRLVRDEVVPGAEWVLTGEGIATRKYDGTCCLVRDGKLFKRYEVKAGGKPPLNFEPANEVDPETGKQQGWVPVGDGNDDKWHREAFANCLKWGGRDYPCFEERAFWAEGTYELCGPKVRGNPEGFPGHLLIPHPCTVYIAFPRTFEEIKKAFSDPEWDGEGVVWHHPDGRMAKIKLKDFGIKRKN